MAKCYFTPTGLSSSYCYQYRHGQEAGDRIIRYDMVRLKQTSDEDRSVTYALIYANGVNKLDPNVELLNMDTSERIRTAVCSLHLVCRQRDQGGVACGCRHHTRLSKAIITGHCGSNINLPPATVPAALAASPKGMETSTLAKLPPAPVPAALTVSPTGMKTSTLASPSVTKERIVPTNSPGALILSLPNVAARAPTAASTVAVPAFNLTATVFNNKLENVINNLRECVLEDEGIISAVQELIGERKLIKEMSAQISNVSEETEEDE